MTTGHIKRLKKESGFGFIRESDTGVEYFFHKSGVLGTNFDDLKESDRVQFEATSSSKGPRAENVQTY